MSTWVWIVSIALALAYLGSGAAKLTLPQDKLRTAMPWSEDFPPPQVKLIGVAEILGALGLVLPKLLDVVDPRAGIEGTLTGLAATGLVLLQAGAIPTHVRRGEAQQIPVNVVLLALAAFVAAARFGWF